MTAVEIRLYAENAAKQLGRPDIVVLGEIAAQLAEQNEIIRENRSRRVGAAWCCCDLQMKDAHCPIHGSLSEKPTT